MNIAIVTARGGSESIRDKNVYPILGKPSVWYPLMAATQSKSIDHVFLFTDCEKIAAVGKAVNCKIIHRSPVRAPNSTNHGDAICTAMEKAIHLVGIPQTVTILLGDTVMVNPDLIDLGNRILGQLPDWDSVMSVWQASDDHPMRALCLSDDGSLQSFLKVTYGEVAPIPTSRQSYVPVYFYDQGIWIFRPEIAKTRQGPGPWWWMGKKVFPLVRRWIAGRDFHSHLDLDIAEWWVSNRKRDEFENWQQIETILNQHASLRCSSK